MTRLSLAIKALRELGLQPMLLYTIYQAELHSGMIGWRTRQPPQVDPGALRTDLLPVPDSKQLRILIGDQAARLICEADEIVAGRAPLFGGEMQPLRLAIPGELKHWTAYTGGSIQIEGESIDIKFIWEPARFGWACSLARAYRLSSDERYAAAFWDYTGQFLDANPPYQGPNWASAQEVALRLIVFVFAAQVFASSAQSTPQRMQRLGRAIAEHAARIPPTLTYARAQNNNHLLSEAAGLLTAGVALPDDPRASSWRDTGRRWFLQGLSSQIAADGAYCQHSANYQRLMLQLGLWVVAIDPRPIPAACLQRLSAAASWLMALIDLPTGQLPNLGPNDGAYILPLTQQPFADYQPVLQAAGKTFQDRQLFPAGEWDEMAAWLQPQNQVSSAAPSAGSPHVLSSTDGTSKAYLRLAHLTSRPGHADQLHLDLWWRGLNLALDPGTYLYNAAPPWDNALTSTLVHNTLTINGQDQMTRAGRFLYLDRAQAHFLEGQQNPDGTWQRIAASHDGYRRLGVDHVRLVDATQPQRWYIEDMLMPVDKQIALRHTPYRIRLHWLLPDWPWELEAGRLRLHSPHGWITLEIQTGLEELALTSSLVRAGELLAGPGPGAPTWGWYAPTYGVKQPALSYAIYLEGQAPLSLTSQWTLPE